MDLWVSREQPIDFILEICEILFSNTVAKIQNFSEIGKSQCVPDVCVGGAFEAHPSASPT